MHCIKRNEIRDSEDTHICGMILMEKATHAQESWAKKRSAMPPCLTAELAIAMDTAYINHLGGKIAAINQVISVMNTVDPNFEGAFDSDIDFQIVECFTPDEDPEEWSDGVNGAVILQEFRSWSHSGGFINDFDIGQMWTTRDFHYLNDFGAIGVAYIKTVCGFSRFHLLEHTSGSSPSVADLRVLTAHEIGHNFGARHDTVTTDFIMKPALNASATEFSSQSKDYINPFLSIINCLTPCGTPCDYLIEVSTSGDYEAMGLIHTSGSVTIGANSLFNAPEVVLNPNFTAITGVVFEISNDGCTGN